MEKTTLRIDDTVYEKIAIIANKEHRSINSQLVIAIENYVQAYENEHGEINLLNK